MKDNDETTKQGAGSNQDADVSLARRGFTNLLALIGGGAALAACAPSAETAGEEVRHATQATTSGLVVITAATIAALRGYTITDADCVVVRGALNERDGGGGLFSWDAASTAADDEGICIRPTSIGVGSPGRWMRMFSGAVNVRWYARLVPATGGDAGDWGPAIRAAVAAARPIADGYYSNRRPGSVYLPTGVYVVRSRVDIDGDPVYRMGAVIEGDGPLQTQVMFVPTAATLTLQGTSYAVCFRFFGTGSSARIAHGGLRDLSINVLTPTGTLYAKCGVLLNNTDGFLMQNVRFGNSWSDHVGNRAIWIQSGQAITLRDITYNGGTSSTDNAGVPIYLEQVANGFYVDHLHMFNLFLRPGNSHHAVEVASDTVLSNFLMDSGNISGGNGFLLWNGGANLQAVGSANIRIANVRFEGGNSLTPPYPYAIDIPRINANDGVINNVTLHNLTFSNTRRGARLDHCDRVTIQNCTFAQTGSNEALDLSKAYTVEVLNCFFTASATVNLGTHILERSDALLPAMGFPGTARIVLPPTDGTPTPGRPVSVTHHTAVLAAGTTFRLPPLQHGYQKVATIAVTARVDPPAGMTVPSVEHGEYALAYAAVGGGYHNLVAMTSSTTRMRGASGADPTARTTTLALSDVIVLDAESYNTLWVRNQTAMSIHILVEVRFSSAA
jgi:hypothetical protein